MADDPMKTPEPDAAARPEAPSAEPADLAAGTEPALDGATAAPDAPEAAAPATETPSAGQDDRAPPPAGPAPWPSPGQPYMNPYLAGLLLGFVLLASFLILGAGLGASGGLARLAAWLEGLVLPARTAASAYFGAWGDRPWAYYLVFMLAGIFAGGLVSALAAGRMVFRVERGRRCPIGRRLGLVLIGGVLSGFASRLAMGCTSGQALTGGAQLMTGSLVFMVCMFASGYLVAWLARRQWHD